jgi:hypothetical protein
VHSFQDAIRVGRGRMHRDLGVPRVVDAQARERVFTKPDNEPASGEQVERLRWFDGDLVGGQYAPSYSIATFRPVAVTVVMSTSHLAPWVNAASMTA